MTNKKLAKQLSELTEIARRVWPEARVYQNPRYRDFWLSKNGLVSGVPLGESFINAKARLEETINREER